MATPSTSSAPSPPQQIKIADISVDREMDNCYIVGTVQRKWEPRRTPTTDGRAAVHVSDDTGGIVLASFIQPQEMYDKFTVGDTYRVTNGTVKPEGKRFGYGKHECFIVFTSNTEVTRLDPAPTGSDEPPVKQVRVIASAPVQAAMHQNVPQETLREVRSSVGGDRNVNVYAFIADVNIEDMGYPICNIEGGCKQKVESLGKDGWQCSNCDTTSMSCSWQLRILLTLRDGYAKLVVSCSGKMAEMLLKMTNDDIIKTITCGEHNNQPQIETGVKDILYDAYNFNLAVTKKLTGPPSVRVINFAEGKVGLYRELLKRFVERVQPSADEE